ncbi:hypothetical protein [Ruegeria arenilitoris]|uniref:hypothetical protein n=1 Tax=Ruegeria arenilitoris TaxID=1173585 RepID=UPI00147AF24D|nr:hypothetical protein [Ruegeria arenilitoris]
MNSKTQDVMDMVNPTIETPRALSRTSYVRCAEWDSVCGTHQGQRSDAPRKQAGHKTASDHTPLTKMSCFAGAIHTGHSGQRMK